MDSKVGKKCQLYFKTIRQLDFDQYERLIYFINTVVNSTLRCKL